MGTITARHDHLRKAWRRLRLQGPEIYPASADHPIPLWSGGPDVFPPTDELEELAATLTAAATAGRARQHQERWRAHKEALDGGAVQARGKRSWASVREAKEPSLRCVADERGKLTWQPKRVEELVRQKWLPQVFQLYGDGGRAPLQWEDFRARYEAYLQEGSQAFPDLCITGQELHDKARAMGDGKRHGLDGFRVAEAKRIPIWLWNIAAQMFNLMEWLRRTTYTGRPGWRGRSAPSCPRGKARTH